MFFITYLANTDLNCMPCKGYRENMYAKWGRSGHHAHLQSWGDPGIVVRWWRGPGAVGMHKVGDRGQGLGIVVRVTL